MPDATATLRFLQQGIPTLKLKKDWNAEKKQNFRI